jgi:3-hydroxyacyl-CoA dehydrogenase
MRKALVLGAGTMGAQIAAHAVAQGLEVALLDVPGPAGDRSGPAKKGLAALGRLKPSPLHLPEHAASIRVGNFEDDLGREAAAADWVLEAVVEDLGVKRPLLAKAASALSKAAVLSTNTSGLSIAALGEGLGAEVGRRFLGTHFFNPPRYLHLLETIPGPATDPEVTAAFESFADRVLGKGVVRAKDRPGFIANRIGAFAVGAALRAMVDLDLTVEEVDALTGPLLGRPRSATLRTMDIAGLDVCLRVSEHLHRSLTDDPDRAVFLLPPFVSELVAQGALGEKSGRGFYKKEGRDILTLDWKTGAYRPRLEPKLASLEAAAAARDPRARAGALLEAADQGGEFTRRTLRETSRYAAAVQPEIAADPASVDAAMEWGYGWRLGPLGLQAGAAAPLPRPARRGVLDLGMVKARAGAVRETSGGASLVDLGDGCALVEFHSKLNTLGPDAFAMLQAAAREAARNFDALVIGNQGENFTAGANLRLALEGARAGRWDALAREVQQFQDANLALQRAEIPVVAAPFGLTLGGGCEIALHAHRVRLSAETYMGLVEAGVGLIPAGGGTKEMALRAHDRCAGVDGADPFPFLKRAFDLVAFARVSTSGEEARRMFLTGADQVSANPDRLLEDARQEALGLARAGHRRRAARTDVPVLGRPALAAFQVGIHNARRGAHISEHDALVATQLARVLCGGDREAGRASEQHYLDLEREAFLSLLGTEKTQERIRAMLEGGKPLRN